MKRLALIASIASLLAVIMITVPAMGFDPFDEACDNIAEGSQRPATCDTPSTDPVSGAEGDGILIRAANFVALVTGVAAVVVLIIAGLQYVTAAGEANKISGAKQAIIFASLGLVVAVAARAIITFVIRRL